MTKREVAYLLIGLGSGLMLSVATLFELLHHMFILSVAWRPGMLVFAVPFVLIVLGIAILVRDRHQRSSN
jgi:hypothetical protein